MSAAIAEHVTRSSFVNWPNVIYNEEVMREGFGIEDVGIPLDARVELLDALSETGLKRITVGAFVSPKFVPADGVLRGDAAEVSSRDGRDVPALHPQPKSQEARPAVFPAAHDRGGNVHAVSSTSATSTSAGTSTAPSSRSWRRGRRLSRSKETGHRRRQDRHRLRMGIQLHGEVRPGLSLLIPRATARADDGGRDRRGRDRAARLAELVPAPRGREQTLDEIRRRWPEIKRFHFHMHNARGMALPAIYAALRTSDPTDTVLLEGTLGGIGGGQYSGNGRAAGMAATEDVMHMLEGMGIETGVNLDKIIECVWMLERIIGRPAFGHVSKAGPRPTTPDAQFDANLPGMESLEAAKHFKLGAGAYEKEGYFPWTEPISGPFRHGTEARGRRARGRSDRLLTVRHWVFCACFSTANKERTHGLRSDGKRRDDPRFSPEVRGGRAPAPLSTLGQDRRVAAAGLHRQDRRHGIAQAAAAGGRTAARAPRSSSAGSCAKRSAAATIRSATSSPTPSISAKWRRRSRRNCSRSGSRGSPRAR